MKKYEVLKDVFDFFIKGDQVDSVTLDGWFKPVGINCLIKDGIIKEIEGPEFTKSDMMDFALYADKNAHIAMDEILISWIKINKDAKK